jgi:hypothetical protein
MSAARRREGQSWRRRSHRFGYDGHQGMRALIAANAGGPHSGSMITSIPCRPAASRNLTGRSAPSVTPVASAPRCRARCSRSALRSAAITSAAPCALAACTAIEPNAPAARARARIRPAAGGHASSAPTTLPARCCPALPQSDCRPRRPHRAGNPRPPGSAAPMIRTVQQARRRTICARLAYGRHHQKQ